MCERFAAGFCCVSEFEGRLVVVPPQRLRQPGRYGAGGLRDRLQYLWPAGQLPVGSGAHTDAGAR